MDENVALRVKQIRKALHMTQVEFANGIGLGQSSIGMIERSLQPISSQGVKALCAVYGVNEDWLLYGKGDMFIKDNALLKRLSRQYALKDDEVELLATFLELPEQTRRSVIDFGHAFIQKLLENRQVTKDELAFDAETARLHKMLDEQRQLEKEASAASSATTYEKQA
jgi:transcriptional regulator with XRE-family HTH domain